MGIHTRTLLVLVCSFILVILLFGAFVYTSASGYTDRDFDRLLELRVKNLLANAASSSTDESSSGNIDDLLDRLSDERDHILHIGPGIGPQEMSIITGATVAFFDRVIARGRADEKVGKRHFKGALYKEGNRQAVVVASAENYYVEHHVSNLRNNVMVGMGIAFVLALTISLYFSSTMFSPLKRITEEVRAITTESLHMRLGEEQSSPELKDLASTFNYLLDRIETAFETQNNFISNASHELRTPLTSIIGEADVALSKPREREYYEETLRVILEEAEQLESKTKALLFLAQTGFGGGKRGFGKVRMDQLLYDVRSTVERMNARHQVVLDMSLLPENPMRLKVFGNEQLLHLAFTNIIMNGCKYSDNQPVMVSLGTSDDQVIIVIKDQGIGISQEDMEHIYDPFFRGANTKAYEGYGIGLPLTQNIIRMHGGRITVKSIVKLGTTVQVSLPIGQFEGTAMAGSNADLIPQHGS